MTDSWQTIPVKQRKWVHNDSAPSLAPISGRDRNSAFRPEHNDRSFSSFGSRPANRETNPVFANKRAVRGDDRVQAQAKFEFDTRRAREEEENTLREALTIESEKEYPSLGPASSSSHKKSSNSLNFKAMVEAPATPNVPKITVIGGAKPGMRPASPKYKNDYEDAEGEYEDEEFNAHIGRRGGDAW